MGHEGATLEPIYSTQASSPHHHFQKPHHHLLEKTQLQLTKAVQEGLGPSGRACVAAAEQELQDEGHEVAHEKLMEGHEDATAALGLHE